MQMECNRDRFYLSKITEIIFLDLVWWQNNHDYKFANEKKSIETYIFQWLCLDIINRYVPLYVVGNVLLCRNHSTSDAKISIITETIKAMIKGFFLLSSD